MGECSFSEIKNIINDSTKGYIDKIETLLLGWKNICTILSKTPAESCDDFLNDLHKSSLKYLLLANWTQLEASLKAKFTVVLHKVLQLLSKTDQNAYVRCKLLIKLIHEPWKNATLHKILHSLPPKDNEVQQYISTEGNDLLLMRLEVLCEEKCEDLALKFASVLKRHLHQNIKFQKNEIDYVNDVYLLLLFRFKRNQEIIEKLKNLNLMEGLDLIKRFVNKKSCDSGIWKFCDKVTEIAAHTILTSAMVQDVEAKDKRNLLYDLVNEWALIHVPKLNMCLSPLCNMVRKVVQKAESPIHVYIFAQVLHKQLGDQVKPLCIELYIRGFTSNINLIEHYKSCNDKEKTLKAEILLSNSFLELSEILHDNIIIHRECILTAFSLYPTDECFKRLEKAAYLCCKNEDDNYLREDNTSVWDNFEPKEKNGDQLVESASSLNILNSDLLGLAPHLCDDLSTVLCSPRCQTLSWSLGWPHLKKQCEKYLAEHFCRKSRSTELKYLNIDYYQLKNQACKFNQSNNKIRKNKINKVLEVNPNFKNQKELPWNGNLSDRQKGELEKDILNYSLLKINEIIHKNFQMNNSSGQPGATSGNYRKKDGMNFELCGDRSLSGENAAKYANRSYSAKFRKKIENNVKSQLNEGYVMSCNVKPSEDISVQIPKPLEVSSSVHLPNSSYYSKLLPLMKSINSGYSQILFSDILSKNAFNVPSRDFVEKTENCEEIKRDKLDRQFLKNDDLLAKYVPGMSSLDLIVPLRPEPTVQVVQIPSSNTVLQPAPSNASSTIQTNSTTMSIAKPLSESISTQSTEIVTTHTQTPHSHIVDTNRDAFNNSNLLLSTVFNQNVSRSHGQDHRYNSILTSNSGVLNNRSQNKSETSNTNEVNVSTEPIGSLHNISSHEGSTQVTAHIQRVGQPHKHKLLYDETNVIKSSSTTNSNVHIPGALQVFDEGPNKLSQSGSLYRFVLKDGKMFEQYQNSTCSLTEASNESNLQGTLPPDQVIKFFKNRKEPKEEEEANNSENLQIPSLPQFHHVFRRQVYQSGSIIEGTSISTSPRQFSDDTIENHKSECMSTTLSKAVQTVLKDAETSTKCSDSLSDESLSVSSTPSTGSDIKEENQASDLQSQSGVIFTCKVPIALPGSTSLTTKPPANILKTTNSQEMFGRNSQKTESESKSKDSVIRSNMNALLAAALQQSTPLKNNCNEPPISQNSIKHCNKVSIHDIKSESISTGTTTIRMPSPTQKNVRRQSLPQSCSASRYSRPSVQSSSVNTITQNVPPVVSLPLSTRNVQVLNVNQNSLSNLSKVDCRRDQLPQNSEQVSVSSTTLEQLREFESVLEQVTNTSQMKERGNAKKSESLVSTPSSSSDYSNSNSPKVNSLFQSSLVNTISDLTNENRVSLAFISKASTTCTNTLISGSSASIATSTPVVVVQNCSSRSLSPPLSITSQNSPGSSPSNSPSCSQTKMNAKLSKPKAKSIGKTAPTATIKVATLPKPQQKPQEDEQTTQRIYAILDKYAEQLRNSPELKNKPAPRRRSNPPTNPSQSSKRKKSSHSKSKSLSNIPSCSGLEMSPGSEDIRTMCSEDSSNGVSQITQTMNSPHSKSEDHSNHGGDMSSDMGESLDKDQRLQHRILLSDQSGGSSRTVIVQDNVQPVISVEGTKVIAGKQLVVGSSATVPLTLQLPSTANVKQVLFPVPTDGRPFVVAKVPKMYRFHQVTMPSGSPLIASAGSGTVLLRQMCLNKSSSTIKQVKLPVVSQISTHMASQPTVVLPSGSQSFTLSTGSPIDNESLGIALDNTILLNSTSTSTSSIGFIQRNVSKSNHSSSAASHHRQMHTQETNTSPGNEIISSIKSESTVVKSENGEMSRISETCVVDYKSGDIKFSLDGNVMSDKQNKSVSTNNNWVQVMKDSNCMTDALHRMHGIDEKSRRRNDFVDVKGCDYFEKSSDKKSNNDVKHQINDQVCTKQQKFVETSSYCINTLSDSKSIINAHHLNDHWQFNIKLEKVSNSVKSESLTSSYRETRDNKGDSVNVVHQNSLSQTQGLKRKVENTIFQIAFKRDKMKLTKDDLVQQRSSSVIERELKLQNSLSEECEDLGVDKPSTSDLFPEAELLLDPDPLSRDSLQGELFHRGDTSSSSLSSPNQSPIFGNKCTNNWKKNKRAMLRHKFNYTRNSSPPRKNITDKADLSRESTQNNISSNPKSIIYEVKHIDNNFKCISKGTDSSNKRELHETDITMECNDSDPCNFSDEHNDTDIVDTEGDSDNDFLHKPSGCKEKCNSPNPKELTVEKSNESSLLRRLTSNTLSKCDYYLNKDDKRSIENSPWYQMLKGFHKESSDSELDKNHCSGGDNNEPQNGILEEFESHQGTINSFVANKLLQTKKRKKVGLFLASESDDSSSSIDTILGESNSCSGFRDNHNAKSSPKGKVKKGYSCVNGLPDLTKKKKDLPTLDKTDKPCSTKTSFSINNKKTVAKTNVKPVNRIR